MRIDCSLFISMCFVTDLCMHLSTLHFGCERLPSIQINMQENTWARLRDSHPDSRNLSHVFSCISAQNSVYAAPDHKGVGRRCRLHHRFDGKKRGEGGMGNFEPTSLSAVGNWHFNFSPPILQLVTSLQFNWPFGSQLLLFVVRVWIGVI